MPKNRHKPEEIVAKLRQVDVLIAQGKPVADAIRTISVTEVTYYRWKQECGGLYADPTFGLHLGYLVVEGSTVPDDNRYMRSCDGLTPKAPVRFGTDVPTRNLATHDVTVSVSAQIFEKLATSA